MKKAIAMVNNAKLNRTMSARPKLFRASSISALLANSPQKSVGDVIDLIEHAPDSKADDISAPAAVDAKDAAAVAKDEVPVVDSVAQDKSVKPDKMEEN